MWNSAKRSIGFEKALMQCGGGNAFCRTYLFLLLGLALLLGCSGGDGDGVRPAPDKEQVAGGADSGPGASGEGELSRSGPEPGDATLTVHYHERVPYMYLEGGRLRGLTADRLALVFDHVGIPYAWRDTPPKRQIEILKAGRGRDVLLGWFKNEERESFARFSEPIYRDLPTIALARAGTLDPGIRPSVEDVLRNANLRLLVRDGYSYGSFLDERIASLALNRVTTTVDNLSMAKMVQAGRADYFFIAEEEASVVIDAAGLPDSEFVRIHFSDMPAMNVRYILYSRAIEPEVVERIDEAIREKLTVRTDTP